MLLFFITDNGLYSLALAPKETRMTVLQPIINPKQENSTDFSKTGAVANIFRLFTGYFYLSEPPLPYYLPLFLKSSSMRFFQLVRTGRDARKSLTVSQTVS